MKTLEITNLHEIEEIISLCDYCVVSMADNDTPYGIPMTFAYEDGTLYLHSGPHGKKNDIIHRNNHVSIVWSHIINKVIYQDIQIGCSYSMECKSVMASGNVEFITEEKEKRRVLDFFMSKFTQNSVRYNDAAVRNVQIWKIKLENITCKYIGYQPNKK